MSASLRHRHSTRKEEQLSDAPDAFPSLDESDDEDVNQGTDRLGDSLENDDTDSAMDEDEVVATEEVEPDGGEEGLNGVGNGILNGLPPRWKNLTIRALSGLGLISGFSLLVYIGPAGLIFLTYLVTTSSYSEVMRLGFKVTSGGSGKTSSGLRRLVWSLYLLQHYFLAGHSVLDYLADFLSAEFHFDSSVLRVLIRHHQAVAFAGYIACLMWFVLLLDTNYIRSYAILAWCHMCLLYLGIPGFMMTTSMFEGMIWYVLPMTLITLNDIAAYYVGFFAGKTPLIKLSPKKTREGFVGGGIITAIFGTYFAYLMMTPYLTSPVKVNGLSDVLGQGLAIFEVQTNLTPNSAFILQPVEFQGTTFYFYPFLLHSFVISLLCSVLGPFGGFLASGFKRGCKRKNFGGFIPGHGGVTDRCDCMFLCAAIIHVYYNSFIHEVPPL